MKVTKIEEQKKNKNRMSVFLDGKFAFGIDNFSLFKLKLKENDEISQDTLSCILETVVFEDAKNYALKLLSSRSYTEKNMYSKLLLRTENETVSQNVIEFLKEYGYINDEDYANRYAADCLNIKKYGKKKIKFKLMEKGISAQVAENAVLNLEDTEKETENLIALAEKKLKGDFDIKNVMKTKRYLASRGYSFDDIDRAIKSLLNEREEELWQTEISQEL